MARVLGLKQLLSKKYTFLENLPEEIDYSFGKLVNNFTMIVWGNSGNGKSSFLMTFVITLMKYGKVLYVALEEGFEATTQMNVVRSLNEQEHTGKIEFADSDMKYDELVNKLKKKKSPRFIIIDSIQYWDCNYERYKALKEMFPNKTFIFISHATGKEPKGATAQAIRFDVGIKARVEGFMVDVVSRYGGNKPYVIWEEGAKTYWGKNFRTAISGNKGGKKVYKTKKEKQKANNEKPETPIHETNVLDRSQESLLGNTALIGKSESVLP